MLDSSCDPGWGAPTDEVVAWSDGTWGHAVPAYRPPPRIRRLEHIAPLWKTQKILGGRSVVADRSQKAAKHYSTDTYYGGELYPGDGLLAHRDGYNVLYGDWHATWYGDPQQRMIWYKNFTYGRGNAAFYATSSGVGSGPNWFNRFDVAENVDTEIKMAYDVPAAY